jgi:hypothetical protein
MTTFGGAIIRLNSSVLSNAPSDVVDVFGVGHTTTMLSLGRSNLAAVACGGDVIFMGGLRYAAFFLNCFPLRLSHPLI